ncbi:MAG TPA: hypothetical protein VD927_14245 [Chryseosolibacter sp.]|nr:hypothetical protein [Chryseosolibacter sp.]
MRVVFFFLIILSVTQVLSQEKDDVVVATQMDLIKSDYDIFFNRVQIGFEGNYFFNEKITGTAGVEMWSSGGMSGVVGARWYPSPNAFIRLRGLLGGVNDFSIGGGFAKPVSEIIRIEAMTDFYFAGAFSIRAGVAYTLPKK